jgi:hypothetical protein
MENKCVDDFFMLSVMWHDCHFIGDKWDYPFSSVSKRPGLHLKSLHHKMPGVDRAVMVPIDQAIYACRPADFSQALGFLIYKAPPSWALRLPAGLGPSQSPPKARGPAGPVSNTESGI